MSGLVTSHIGRPAYAIPKPVDTFERSPRDVAGLRGTTSMVVVEAPSVPAVTSDAREDSSPRSTFLTSVRRGVAYGWQRLTELFKRAPSQPALEYTPRSRCIRAALATLQGGAHPSHIELRLHATAILALAEGEPSIDARNAHAAECVTEGVRAALERPGTPESGAFFASLLASFGDDLASRQLRAQAQELGLALSTMFKLLPDEQDQALRAGLDFAPLFEPTFYANAVVPCVTAMATATRSGKAADRERACEALHALEAQASNDPARRIVAALRRELGESAKVVALATPRLATTSLSAALQALLRTGDAELAEARLHGEAARAFLGGAEPSFGSRVVDVMFSEGLERFLALGVRDAKVCALVGRAMAAAAQRLIHRHRSTFAREAEFGYARLAAGLAASVANDAEFSVGYKHGGRAAQATFDYDRDVAPLVARIAAGVASAEELAPLRASARGPEEGRMVAHLELAARSRDRGPAQLRSPQASTSRTVMR